MLDRYWEGNVERISPEAPVPIVKVSTRNDRLGGAANVARNLKSLGTTPLLVGCIGLDDAGSAIKAELVKADIKSSLLELKELQTIVKLRVASKNHQMLRVDFDEDIPYGAAEELLRIVERKVSDVDAVLLSDYGKGSLQKVREIIVQSKQHNIPIVIDPKGADYAKYSDATLITPNRSELRQIIGTWKSETDLQQKAETLRKELRLGAILLTRSEEGMSLFHETGVHNIAAIAQEVSDVTGAGDTAIATLAAFLASGSTMVESMRLANLAASKVVQKFGTACVTYEELMSGKLL
jgi:rfaE bifunctional protein kinase chain/domain